MSEIIGQGCSVPPETKHVIIYFNEKGASDELALSFLAYWSKKGWLSNRLRPLSNWKVAAWTWIYYHSPGL